jgi:hypothetical protein
MSNPEMEFNLGAPAGFRSHISALMSEVAGWRVLTIAYIRGIWRSIQATACIEEPKLNENWPEFGSFCP